MEEQDLVRRIKEGDRQAFEALYRLYADRALRTAAVWTTDRMSAADAVQEAFLRVYRYIRTYDESVPFLPWFHKILLNECHRVNKKQSKTVPVAIDDELASPQTDTYDFEERDSIYRLVKMLESPLQVPIVLKYVNDMSDQNIAEVMELNVNTVKSRLFKAKRKLKELLMRRKGGGEHEGLL